MQLNNIEAVCFLMLTLFLNSSTMLAEIITIGDEILIGQIVDTNSAWMAQKLNLAGIRVKQITSVSDDKNHIISALKEAEARVDIILITGGLGPTKDDITKNTLKDYFNCGWRLDEAVLSDVTRIFSKYGREVTEVNRLQAQVPDCCTTIRNHNGTAPAMWFEKSKKVFVSMPGVPYEMKAIMTNDVIPMLSKKFKTPFIHHRTVLTQGVGESMLAEMISNWEDNLPSNFKLAYLPALGSVRLRLSAVGANEAEIKSIADEKIQLLKPIIQEHIFGYENETLEEIIGELLRERKQTLATAESFTGGSISAAITKIPGSSDYYQGSVVSYANEIKVNELGVSESDLKNFGAVSQQVAEQMAIGVKQKFKTNYAISTTGIAGPSGGSEAKPVGMAWIAIAGPKGVISKKFTFGEQRQAIIQRATLTALNMLRKAIVNAEL
jgi:nicotinamide-nucleotide amidase